MENLITPLYLCLCFFDAFRMPTSSTVTLTLVFVGSWLIHPVLMGIELVLLAWTFSNLEPMAQWEQALQVQIDD